jgi:hypothetical protein
MGIRREGKRAIFSGAATVLAVAVLSGCSSSATADFRAATPVELSPPSGLLDPLANALGVKFANPTETMVDAAIASEVARAAYPTEYASQIADKVHSQYLQEAVGLEGKSEPEAVWVVIYTDLSIPVLAPGGAKSESEIHTIYVMVSAESGAFLNYLYTS